MSKKTGILITLIGILVTIGGLFFDFFDTGTMSFNGWESLLYFFQNLGDYFGVIGQIGTIFQSDITTGVLVLFPLLFLGGLIFLLIGLKIKIVAIIGWLFMSIPPLTYLVFNIIIELVGGTAFSAILGNAGIGFYLSFVAVFVILIGIILNKEK